MFHLDGKFLLLFRKKKMNDVIFYFILGQDINTKAMFEPVADFYCNCDIKEAFDGDSAEWGASAYRNIRIRRIATFL